MFEGDVNGLKLILYTAGNRPILVKWSIVTTYWRFTGLRVEEMVSTCSRSCIYIYIYIYIYIE
jgi:hypothetical protein